MVRDKNPTAHKGVLFFGLEETTFLTRKYSFQHLIITKTGTIIVLCPKGNMCVQAQYVCC
jgi:hypothetical protein